jgi:hypothetical protein
MRGTRIGTGRPTPSARFCACSRAVRCADGHLVFSCRKGGGECQAGFYAEGIVGGVSGGLRGVFTGMGVLAKSEDRNERENFGANLDQPGNTRAYSRADKQGGIAVNPIFRTSLLVCWFVCCGVTGAVAQSSESQDAAERRAKAFASAISSPDHAKWQRFLGSRGIWCGWEFDRCACTVVLNLVVYSYGRLGMLS